MVDLNFGEQVVGLMQAGVDGAFIFGVAYLVTRLLETIVVASAVVYGIRWVVIFVKTCADND